MIDHVFSKEQLIQATFQTKLLILSIIKPEFFNKLDRNVRKLLEHLAFYAIVDEGDRIHIEKDIDPMPKHAQDVLLKTSTTID